ncbi:MAG: nucleotidyl transferase AbiEii/AbiGii toxin family protein [Atopobiaceae bacterium]|nr:nucleotidyl transferase AbiEii/AbiGii toxin family protein [Atopobiaceae bacterium]
MSGRRGKIKIEINTFERSPMLPLASRTLDVASPWCACRQDIPTFQAEELVATKLRALYQRSKGRDLFDLWLADRVGAGARLDRRGVPRLQAGGRHRQAHADQPRPEARRP